MYKDSGLLVEDVKGNKRRLTQGRVKNKSIDLNQFYLDSYLDRLSEIAKKKSVEFPLYPKYFKPYNDIWRYEPVEHKYFFKRMIGESLYKGEQEEFAKNLFGDDPFRIRNLDKRLFVLFWGKRSGKDSTIAKCYTYICYLLCCLHNPQEFLGLGKGSRVDIVNVCVDSWSAKQIFFKELKNQVKSCIDPDTGKNWFASKNFYFDIGEKKFKRMDLREKEDIQRQQIDFKRGISAHSLNGDTFTGEGLNILIGAIDEIGGFKVGKIFGSEDEIGMFDSLKTTVDSTSKFGALFCMSYKYNKNCAMSVLYRKYKDDSEVYASKASAFDVRPTFKKSMVAKIYERNPAKAKMMFECEDVDIDVNLFYENKNKLLSAIDEKGKWVKNPIIGGNVIVNDIGNLTDLFQDWFFGKKDVIYKAHVDLAKGKVKSGGDAIGLAIGHSEEMRVSYDDVYLKMMKEDYDVDLVQYEGEVRNGIIVDLAIQIIAKEGEVDISDVRKFLIYLKLGRKFDIDEITYDGWQSLESIQQINKVGIESNLFSVDKNREAYETEKGLIYSGLYKIYPNFVWRREKRELMEVNNKIDHPRLSNERAELEGVEHGSKDVSDATVAVAYNLIKYYDGLNVYAFG